METVGIFSFYFCAAIFVPILLARFVVRADWRTIRNAGFLWYGVLVVIGLSGSVQTKGEGLGWTLILATFCSFWGLPALALIFKLWGLLGATSGQAAVGTARHPFWARFPLSVMSPLQWAVAALLLVGVVAYSFWRDQRDLNASVHVLRQMFAVPEGAVVREARRLTEAPVETPRVEAIVQLTPVQFEGFRARMEADRAWPGANARFGGAPLDVTSPETIRWRALPAKIKVGKHWTHWSRLTAAPVEGIRNGRVLCLSLRRSARNTHAESGIEDSPHYVAQDCADVAPDERGGLVALAALDLDSRTLYMIIE